MHNTDRQDASTLEDIRCLSELIESDVQFAHSLLNIPLCDLPERLENEGFDANELIGLLRNDLIDIINRHKSSKALGLTGILEISFSRLEQAYPDLAKDLIVAIQTIAARTDDSLLSVAGGTSHSSDWKQHASKSSTPDSDSQKKKEIAEAVGGVAIGVLGISAIKVGVDKLIKKGRDRQFDHMIDQRLKKASDNKEKNELKFGEHKEEAFQNRVQNRSNSLKNENWDKLKAVSSKLTSAKLDDLAGKLTPREFRTVKLIRSERLAKARQHWKKNFEDITSDAKLNKVQFKENVSVREISQTIHQRINHSGKSAYNLKSVTKDLPDRELRSNPLEDLKSELYSQGFIAGDREKFLAKEFRNLNSSASSRVSRIEIRDYGRIETREAGRKVTPSEDRPAQLRGILKRPNIIPKSDLEHLDIAAQNMDISDLDLTRVSRKLSRIDIDTTRPSHSDNSNRLSQAFREASINGSLLEDRVEFQRELIQHESILAPDISNAIEDTNQAFGKVISNAEHEVEDAVITEVEDIDSAIDDVADGL